MQTTIHSNIRATWNICFSTHNPNAAPELSSHLKRKRAWLLCITMWQHSIMPNLLEGFLRRKCPPAHCGNQKAAALVTFHNVRVIIQTKNLHLASIQLPKENSQQKDRNPGVSGCATQYLSQEKPEESLEAAEAPKQKAARMNMTHRHHPLMQILLAKGKTAEE